MAFRTDFNELGVKGEFSRWCPIIFLDFICSFGGPMRLKALAVAPSCQTGEACWMEQMVTTLTFNSKIAMETTLCLWAATVQTPSPRMFSLEVRMIHLIWGKAMIALVCVWLWEITHPSCCQPHSLNYSWLSHSQCTLKGRKQWDYNILKTLEDVAMCQSNDITTSVIHQQCGLNMGRSCAEL